MHALLQDYIIMQPLMNNHMDIYKYNRKLQSTGMQIVKSTPACSTGRVTKLTFVRWQANKGLHHRRFIKTCMQAYSKNHARHNVARVTTNVTKGFAEPTHSAPLQILLAF